MAKKNIRTRSRLKKAQQAVQEKQYGTACQLYEEVCKLDKRDADSWFSLGTVCLQLSRHDAAQNALQQCLLLQPDNLMANYHLAMSLQAGNDLKGSLRYLEHACKLDANSLLFAEALAKTYMGLRLFKKADEVLAAFLEGKSGHAETWLARGAINQLQGCLAQAEQYYRKAKSINSAIPMMYENLGSVLSMQGMYNEAIECYQEGLAKTPGNLALYSNYLLNLNYVVNRSQQAQFEAHQEWERRAGRQAVNAVFGNTKDQARRLRVGYVSPDLREHSVASFFEPLLEMHDPGKFEIFCYSSAAGPDLVTRRLQTLSHHWRDIAKTRDDAVVGMVRRDKVDILVDLAGHTSGNRLGVFLKRSAPVQVTWLGYPNTTGLTDMDYRFTDAIADPEGQGKYYSEKLLRLPGCFLCYQAPEKSPDVAELPAQQNGYLTFGSFNNVAKLNDTVFDLWAELLQCVDGSKIVIKNTSLSDAQSKSRVMDYFMARGIDSDRVEVIGYIEAREDHLAYYSRIDIALDCFPYNGTTTSCEALWMGVPTISLVGEFHAARVGFSLLSAAGMSDWCVRSKGDYIGLAKHWSVDISGLAKLRAGLRERLCASALCDKKTFAADMEQAYRQIWGNYCQTD